MTEAPPRSNLSPESSKWVEWANRNILNLLSRSTETIQTAARAANAVNAAQDTSVVQQTHLETINEGLLDTQAQVDSVESIAIDAYEQTTIEPAPPRQIDGTGGWILTNGTEVSFGDFELLTEEEKEDAEYIPARPVNSVWDVKMDGSQLQDERWIWDGDTWTQYLIGNDVLDPDIIGNAYNYIANLAGSIVQVSPTEPVDPVSGTLWWQTDSSGVRFKGLWHYDGTAWQSYTLAANDIVAANSITTPLLSAGALDAFQITSPLIQSVATADRGIKWTGDVITGYTNTGDVGFQFDAGQATINGGSIIGGTITQSSNGTGDNVILSNGTIQFETLTGDLGGSLQAGYITLWDSSEQRTQLWSNALQLTKLGSSDLTSVSRGRFDTRVGDARAALTQTALTFSELSPPEYFTTVRAIYGSSGVLLNTADPEDPQAGPSISISTEGIGHTIYHEGTQLLTWDRLFNPLVLGKFDSFSIGDGASTVEPGITLYRRDPSTSGEISAKLYLANITGGVPSIEIRKGGSTAGIFRIYESGRISMRTYAASSTADATRDLPFAIETGSVYVEALASNTASTFPITFATNRFTKPPVVVASIRGTSGALRHTVAVQSPVTTTGCTLRAANFTTVTGGNHYIEWIAIQATV